MAKLKVVMSVLHKSTKKKIMHLNKASRTISKLQRYNRNFKIIFFSVILKKTFLFLFFNFSCLNSASFRGRN